MKSLRLIWRMIVYRPGLYLANQLAWLAAYLLPIAVGLVTRALFDTLSSATQTGYNVWTLVALFVALSTSRVVMIYIGILAHVKQEFVMGGFLQRNMLAGILRRPGARAITVSPGEAISVFRDDVGQVREGLSWMVDVINSITRSVTSIVIMAMVSPKLTLLVLLPLALITTLINKASEAIQKYRQASREATSQLTDVLGEVFSAMQAVQVAVAEEAVASHIHALNENRRQTILKDRSVNLILEALMSNAASIGTGLVLLLVGQSMRSGSFSVGDFALFVGYLDQFSHFTRELGFFMAHMKQTDVSVERMANLMHGSVEDLVAASPLPIMGEEIPAVPVVASSEHDWLQTLEVNGLSYRYPDTGRGVENISIKIKRGSFTVITGRVGSGKTTALRSLLGLLPPDTGEIRWNGQLVEDPAELMTPPRTAYTGQVPVLFSDSIQDNVRMGQPLPDEVVFKSVYQAVLEPDIQGMELGLKTPIGPRGVKLSGGQVQRVATARMFARQADLLVFDDLSSALDVETESVLWARVFADTDATCLVASHRQAALMRADHIIVLKDGKVEDEGTLDELLQRSSEMQQIWSSQAAQSSAR